MIQTSRLRLRELVADDAPFILKLVNEPSWLRFIGDKNVRTLDDARGYIANGPGASYALHGFGLYLVALADGATPIGMCGLIKRDTLQEVDIGFAYLPAYWGQGYALEAALGVVEDGRNRVGLRRLAAITSPDNAGSIRVVEKLGLKPQGPVELTPGGPPTLLFVGDL